MGSKILQFFSIWYVLPYKIKITYVNFDGVPMFAKIRISMFSE